MESRDELEHPLLAASPTHSGGNGGGLFKGILARREEENTLPPVAWRGYSGAAEHHQPQFLDPCSLPKTLEPFYPPASIWGNPPSLGLHSKDYLETTFVDLGPTSPLDRKLLREMRDVHSVSYNMDDEDDLLQDYEVVLRTRLLTRSKMYPQAEPSLVLLVEFFW